MSLIIGCLLGFFFVLMILEIAVNWQINASQFEDQKGKAMKRKKSESKYIVLTDQHLYVADDLKQIEKQSGFTLDESEMKRIDGHYITKLDDVAIDFVIDKKRMSNIPWRNLIKKDMTMQYLLYGMLGLQVILLLKG